MANNFCGEPLTTEIANEIMRKSNCGTYNFYGSAEYVTWIFYCNLGRLKTMNPDAFKSIYMPIGTPLRNVEYRIESNSELVIKTPYKQAFYIHESGKKEELREPKNDCFGTVGDRAKIDSNTGLVYCLGRLNGLIKISGIQVDTHQVALL